MLSASLTAALVALSVSAAGVPAAADAGLHIVDLGSLAGTCCSAATAINDNGVVVGESQVGTGENPPSRAFRWRDGTMIDLGTLGGPSAAATAINNNGWIVGYSMLADGVSTHGFLWRPGIGMTDLGSLGADSVATGVNDSGVVVGRYVDLTQEGPDRLRGFRWANGVMTQLTTPSGAGFDAVGINKHGKVAGTSLGEPATWKNGTVVQYGLGAQATAINDSGDVAADHAIPSYGVFVWRHDIGSNTPLFWPPGTAYANTTGINESRHVVGWRTTTDGKVRGVYWSENGTPRLLPGLVPGGQSVASGVNKYGQTVGRANVSSTGGEYTAVLWTR